MTNQNKSLDSEPPIERENTKAFPGLEDTVFRVILYRAALLVAALSFSLGVILVLGWGKAVLPWLTPVYGLFCLALGVSLLTINMLITMLLRGFQLLWVIGVLAALWVEYDRPRRRLGCSASGNPTPPSCLASKFTSESG